MDIDVSLISGSSPEFALKYPLRQRQSCSDLWKYILENSGTLRTTHVDIWVWQDEDDEAWERLCDPNFSFGTPKYKYIWKNTVTSQHNGVFSTVSQIGKICVEAHQGASVPLGRSRSGGMNPTPGSPVQSGHVAARCLQGMNYFLNKSARRERMILSLFIPRGMWDMGRQRRRSWSLAPAMVSFVDISLLCFSQLWSHMSPWGLTQKLELLLGTSRGTLNLELKWFSTLTFWGRLCMSHCSPCADGLVVWVCFGPFGYHGIIDLFGKPI